MGHRLIRQVNGHYAVYSTVDNLILYDCTREDLIREYTEDAAQKAAEDTAAWVDGKLLGRIACAPDSIIEDIREAHGDEEAEKAKALLTNPVVPPTDPSILVWATHPDHPSVQEAILGNFAGGDGCRFTLDHRPTCYRRGPFHLFVEVAHARHIDWGCFDDQDQPSRWYHSKDAALSEAQAIANVLWTDRRKRVR